MLVINAPDERELVALLTRVDRSLFPARRRRARRFPLERPQAAGPHRLGPRRRMIVLSGAELVLPDRILVAGHAGDRRRSHRRHPARRLVQAAPRSPFHGHYIVPGFIDVHVHGVDGVDSLDDGGAIARMAARLPRYGVTAFCPTTVACAPAALRRVLDAGRGGARASRQPRGARVLPAHLESNFISPDYSRRAARRAACAVRGRRWTAGQVGRAGQAGRGRRRRRRRHGETSTGRTSCARSSARRPTSAS